MTGSTFFNFLIALLVVMGLIGILAWSGKRLGMIPGVTGGRRNKNRRIRIVEVASGDAKRRLLLVRRDNVEHLVLLGAANELVIETGIGADAEAGTRRIGKGAKAAGEEVPWLDG